MDYETILSLVALIALQNVLGTDNNLFISLTTEKLTGRKKRIARLTGMFAAVVLRIVLLLAVNSLLSAENTLFTFKDHSFSVKSIILILGGIFLIYSSTKEIFRSTETAKHVRKRNDTVSFVKVLVQLVVIDFLFSVESVVTAIGITSETWVMYAGVGVGILLMLLLSLNVNKILTAHPSLKVLAFCFLFLLGFLLICDGLEMDIPKSYIYFIMIFAVAIDLVQIKLRGKQVSPGY